MRKKRKNTWLILAMGKDLDDADGSNIITLKSLACLSNSSVNVKRRSRRKVDNPLTLELRVGHIHPNKECENLSRSSICE